ncbi:uncharacterized protein LOC130713394 [Lotus japonicus]|uniref:uncharacterized protein LOC130713394 n=1 Tax=Lotus japonicus TaxID=34305 RepID=UPI002590D7E9|nr:uncharacterized protein LOC130713394 [Lotus japonicus]
MKWSELEAGVTGCKVHPNNKQLPGVCSSCLRDKLLILSNKQASSSSPPSSNYMSPAYRGHHRHVSSVMDSVSSMISLNYGLKRSRTIAFASGSLRREKEVNRNKKESKKGGLWSKLLRLTRKNTNEASMHSGNE